MSEQILDRLRRGVLLAPIVFAAHFLEESPGFVAWFNAHVTRGITQDLFWTVAVHGYRILFLGSRLF